MSLRYPPRAAAVLCFSVWALASADAGAQDAPRRKPGLWQQTVTMSGPGAPPQLMSICTDEKTDNLMANRAGSDQKCTQQSVRRQGNAFVVDAVCKDGKTTIHTHGTFTGDFTSRYSGELRSTFEPPMHGMKEMTQKIDARWVGPCKPGQKPGDVMVEGVGRLNIQEMMGADPQKMREMMQQMQQQQPR
ncbi:MAG: DUF3617 family protein [Betaproteobacteria bacterium]|nr:MAG: DUF3617 family protein [Betaproteobacteria bacterium]